MEKNSSKENSPQTLGAYLKALRGASGFSLRDVEEATEVSNAYVSQMENDKISKPSPHILHKLASFYGVGYEVLMEKAGYIKRDTAGEKTGRLAASSLGTISRDEEAALLQYLGYIRSQKRK
jgi:HTH-type transcriptional regulator, competence development regulator